MEKIKFWLNNSRPVSLPQSVMPALVAFFVAFGVGTGFSWWLGILAIVGGCFAHLGMNLADDYFDYKKKESGYREAIVRKGFRARTVKCPYIQSGEADLKQTLKAIIVFGLIALIPGIIVLIFRGWPIALIVAIAVFLGLSYSGGPLKLSYRGLGEPDIGIMFGPLLMAGVFYAACGHLDIILLAPAISMGLLVTNVVYIHSVMDYHADKEANKATLAALIVGKKSFEERRGALFAMLSVFMLVPYAITAIIALVTAFVPVGVSKVEILLGDFMSAMTGQDFGIGKANVWNLLYLAVFITLPMAIHYLKSVHEFLYHPEHTDNPDYPLEPGPLTGSMANWEAIKEAKLDWFMYRWYMARNIMTAFAVVYIIVSIIVKFL